ncbi:MAG TPA: histidinol-phosphatase, partial [Bacteroidales bacterium]|nr:histidinol-phosphatase [Bacteroidales bacterium]
MVYRTDYHMHSTFSDGRTSPEEYIGPAIDAGIREIGFSDHLTLFRDPEHWNMDPARVPEYIDYVERLKQKTKEINIRTGLEVDYFEGREQETGEFLKPFNLDYIIGSVHFQGEVTVDLGPQFYEGNDIDTLFARYFKTVEAAVASGLFDIIGHCDLIRIYGYRPEGDIEPLYRSLAGCMKKHDVAFEINTNGRNRPLADFYPDRKFLRIFMEEGV